MKLAARVGLLFVAAIVVVGVLAYAIASGVTRVGRDAAMAGLRDQLAQPAPEPSPGSPTDPKAPEPGGTAQTPPELRKLRDDLSSLAETLADRSAENDPHSLWRQARDIFDALRFSKKTVADLSDADLDVFRQFLAIDEAEWQALESLEWSRIREAVMLPGTRRKETADTWVLANNSLFRHTAEAVLDLRAGNADAAVRDLTAWLRTQEISHVCCEDMTLTANLIRAAVETGSVSRETEDRLLSQLAKNRSRTAFRRQQELVLASKANLLGESPEYIRGNPHHRAGSVVQALGRFTGAPLINRDIEYFAKNAHRAVEASSLPHLEAMKAVEELRAEFGERFLGSFGGNALLYELADPELFVGRATNEARLDLTRLAVALERYRADHGAYPETLDALDDRFPGGMPEDPFSGQSYLYTTDGQSFRLASAHRDGMTDELDWTTPRVNP